MVMYVSIALKFSEPITKILYHFEISIFEFDQHIFCISHVA